MTLTGIAPTAEVLGAGSALARRLYGWRRFSFFIYIAVLAAQAYVWLSLPEAFGLNGNLAGLGFGATTALVIFGYLRWCRGLGQKGWARLGALSEIELRYDLTPSGLRITSGNGVETSVPWGAILSLCREKTLWLVVTTGGSAIYLPRRFFTDHLQEKAFVTRCLECLSPAARARSGEAVAFAQEP